jgi:hypothetical protein
VRESRFEESHFVTSRFTNEGSLSECIPRPWITRTQE